MNHLALAACRKTLMLDVTEASQYIGGVEPRTWRYYESGRRTIPPTVISRMEGLLQRRSSALQELTDKAEEYKKLGKGRLVVPYYLDFELFSQETGITDLLEWRIDMHVKAILYINNLVVFY